MRLFFLILAALPVMRAKYEIEREKLDQQCTNMCSGHGKCVSGECECEEGRDGEDCSMVVCLRQCGYHGRCVDGVCECFKGWGGDDCLMVVKEVPKMRSRALNMSNRSHNASSRAADVVPVNISGGRLQEPASFPASNGTQAAPNQSNSTNFTTNSDDVSPFWNVTMLPRKRRNLTNTTNGTNTLNGTAAAATPLVPYPDGTVCTNDCSGHGFCFMGECQCDAGFWGTCCCHGEAPPTAAELAASAKLADLAAEQARLRATLDPMHVEHPDFDDRFLKPNYDDDDDDQASNSSTPSQPSSWLQLEQRYRSALAPSRRSLSPAALSEQAGGAEDVCGC